MSRWRITPLSSAPSSRHTASERAGSGSCAFSSTLRRGSGTAARLVRCTAMEGVTVVDHVLLRRLVSILRDRETPHGVFRQTLDDAAMILAYEAMRILRTHEIEIETPLETGRGAAARRRGRRRRDPARRARHRRRLPAAGPGRARRPPRHVPRRGDAAAGRLLRERAERRRRGRGVRGRPDARDGRQRDAGDRPAQARGRGAGHVRLPRRRARGRRGAARRPSRGADPDAALDRELDGNGYIRPGLGDAGDRIFGTDR